MRKSIHYIQIVSIVISFFGNLVFAQSDKVLQSAKEAEQEFAAMSKEERKISSHIFHLLKEYEDSVKGNPIPSKALSLRPAPFEMDAQKRVLITVVVSPGSDPSEIENLVLKENGVISRAIMYGGIKYQYHCRVYPTTIRKLAALSSVVGIRDVLGGYTRSIISKGDAQ